MRKFLLFFILFSSLLLNNVYWYDLTQNEEDLIIKITNKIEDNIVKKWENYRNKYSQALLSVIEKYEDNDRIETLINSINENINTSKNREIQDKILAELDEEWLPNLKFLYTDEVIENAPFVYSRLLKSREEEFEKLLETKDENINFDLIENFTANNKLWYLYNLIENYRYINWKDNVNHVYNDFQLKISDLGNKIGYSKDLYNIYLKVKQKWNLTEEQTRIIDRAISSFELEWISLSNSDIEELQEINKELISLSYDFSENLLNSQRNYRYYLENWDDIEELPKDVLEYAHEYALDEDKNWYLFNYNSAGYLINYSSSTDIRKEVRNDFKNFSYWWEKW